MAGDGEPLDEWDTVDSCPEDVISEFEERSSDDSRVSGPHASDASPKSTSGTVPEGLPPAARPSAAGAGGQALPEAAAAAVSEELSSLEAEDKHEGGAPRGADKSRQRKASGVTDVTTETESPGQLETSQEHLSEVHMSPLQPPASVLVDASAAPPSMDVGDMSREHIAPTNEPIVESPKARNWGWGWGAVSGALKEVSAGVAKDVQELKASFQAAIRVDSDEEEEEEEEMAEKEEEDFVAPAAAAAAEPTQEELKRQQVLQRLEGDNTEIEKGLKALDDQVEHLASGLWGLVGKAGRGVGTLARQMEAATKEAASGVALEFQETLEDVKSLHAVKLASTGIAAAAGTGRRLVQTAEKGLENMGRTAVSILESGWDEELTDDYLDESATFDELFRAAGGTAALEEAEELGNECARLFNRGRRGLDEGRREELDKQAAAFAPLFDLSSKLVDASEGGKATVPLAEEYSAVEAMRMQSVEHALHLSSAASQLAKDQLSPMDLSTGSDPGTASSESDVLAEQQARATMAIRSLKGEALSCLAQVSAASVKHLLKVTPWPSASALCFSVALPPAAAPTAL